jgi:ABC-type nickel/cobalt efflux system permease component RcnA
MEDIVMQLVNPWFVVAALMVLVAVLQWWVMRTIHLKRLAEVRARHHSAQQAAATLLQQARQQTALVQLELAAAREAIKRRANAALPRPTAGAIARERLNKLLDEASAAQDALPPNGFADTMPSMQFAPSTSFGLLQRSSPTAM